MLRYSIILTLLTFGLVSHGQSDPLKGLTINVIGDSYVANHKAPKEQSWHAKVAKMHGMTYNNYGRNGNCVAFDRDRFGKAMITRYTQMTDSADIILVIAGHNDATMIGDNADSLRIFEKCLDSLFYALREKYPDGHIGYVTPWYLATKGFKPVVKVIRRMCRKHSIPLLDNYKKSSVVKVRDAEFRRRYFQSPTDTAHLNDSGHDLFLPIGEQFIISLVTKP